MSQLPITVSGNLTDDPKFRAFETGTNLCRLRVATSRRVRTDDTDDAGNPVWADVDSLYIDAECWGQLAVNCNASLRRGMPVVVIGRLVTETWKDQEGNNRSRHLIRANQVSLELSRLQVASRSTSVQAHEPDGMEKVTVQTRDDMVKEGGEVPVAAKNGNEGEAAQHDSSPEPGEEGVRMRRENIQDVRSAQQRNGDARAAGEQEAQRETAAVPA